MIPEKTVLQLLLIKHLIDRNEWVIRELGWEIGVKQPVVESLLEELSQHYMLEINSGRVFWNPADIPSYIKPWGWTIIHRSLLGSTQDAARGHPPWTVIVAEYMLWGKGRTGKTWVTGLGGLWITLKVMVDPSTASMLPVLVPTILVRILRKNIGVDAWIKWPNDVIVDDKKLAGILVEAEAFKEQIIAYIGVGLNVNNKPPVEEAVSLKDVLGGITPRNRVLSMIIGWISRAPKLAEKPDEIREEYREYLSTLNRRVQAIMMNGSRIEGIAKGIDEYGSLILETDKGVIKIDATETYQLRHLE